MKAFLAFVLTGALLALPSCATLPPVGADVPAPGLRAGDTWTYNEYDGYNGRLRGSFSYVVEEITGDRMTVAETPGGATRQFTPAWNPSSGTLPENRAVGFDPPFPRLRFPLHDGSRWSGKTIATDVRTGAKFSVGVSARVLGRERIKTGAGDFDAVKIVYDVYPGDEQWWRTRTMLTEVVWYAPEVKAMVRYSDRSYYYDKTRSPDGPFGMNNLVNNSRTVLELASYSLRPR